MGDAQSAQRERDKDAAAEEDRGQVDDVQTEQNIEDKPLKNNVPISEINGKADSSIAAFNGHREDETAAEAIVLETEEPLEEEEETRLENVKISENTMPDEADADEEVPVEMLEAKQNDINDSFRRFFSNIGLKLTVKRGSSEKVEVATHVPEEEPSTPEDIEDTAKDIKSENAEQSTDLNAAQEAYDNDSTTCPTLTDVTSEEFLENAEDKTTETKEEVQSENADAGRTSPVSEDAHQDDTPEQEPHPTSPSVPDQEVVASPFKRFFTTGIFSGLRKKKKAADDEATVKELVDVGNEETVETMEQTEGEYQQDGQITRSIEAAKLEKELNEFKEEILTMDDAKSPSMDPSIIIVNQPESLSSQEKVQASPLKRLLSGSSLKRLSKKPRSRKSSDAKLSDFGEHPSDQLLSSTEAAEHKREKSPAQPAAEAAGEEDGAWASFKKLMTPKKRMKRPSLGHEEVQVPGSVDEPKPSEGEQISDHSTEEGRKRKDSSVSWEAVLCGSGRRRSRKTSDSEEETPQTDKAESKQNSGAKQDAESSPESSNEVHEILASSPKQAGSPSDSDGGSTWKSFKKLVTPKRKAKDEDESKDNMQSDSEVTQEDSSFSIKKILPGRKKRRSAEKQDQVSSDEADKEVASGDEDSETPAVVPLSEFDTVETVVPMQTQADIESSAPKEADRALEQDLLDGMTEPVLPCDSLQTEAKMVQDNEEGLENKASKAPVAKKEPDDLAELISKHQQLSDIPEEGMITETMATPASVTEEAVRDDTIADDLIEITSEAVTAPEPVDITQADETEMISAVSQLSESSKTSGNTTPVPAEYDVKDTDLLLQKVAETISSSPNTIPVGSDTLSSERIVCSAPHQISETKNLEIHSRSDATSICTGLHAEAIDAINELTATAQTESVSDTNEAISIEIISEVLTEEFDTAEIATDEILDISVSHLQESVKEFETTDESQHMVEYLSEVKEAVPIETLTEGEEVPLDSEVWADKAENKISKTESREAELAPRVADETKDGSMKIEVQILAEKKDQFIQNVSVDIEDQPSVVVEKLELGALATVETSALVSVKGSVQSLEKQVPFSEDILQAETITDEPKQTAEHLTGVTFEPEKEELQTEAHKIDRSEAIKVLEVVQAVTLDSGEGSVPSLGKEVTSSEDILQAETITDEPKQTAEHLTQVTVEPEKEETQTEAQEIDHCDVTKILEVVQEPTMDSGDKSVQSLEKEVPSSEDIPPAELDRGDPKETAEDLTEVPVEPEKEDLETEAPKIDRSEAIEVLEVVQAVTLDSGDKSVQSLGKEVPSSEDILQAETTTDEPKQTAEHLTEVTVEPEKEEPETESQEIDHCHITDVLEVVQAATLDSGDKSVQSLPKEVPSSEVIPPPEIITDEPKQTAEHLTEVPVEPEKEDLQTEAHKIDHSEAIEVLQVVRAVTLDSGEGSVPSLGKKVPSSEDILQAETITDEPKQTAEHLTKVTVEPEKEETQTEAQKTGHCDVTNVLEVVQEPTLDSGEGSLQSLEKEVLLSKTIPPAEIDADEPKQAEHLTEVTVEPEKEEPETESQEIDHCHVTEVLEVVQAATLDSGDKSVQSLPKEVPSSEVIPPAELDRGDPKEREEHLTEVPVEPEKEDLETEAPKIDRSEAIEVLEVVQTVTLDSGDKSVQSLGKEVPSSEDILQAETITDEPIQIAEHLTEVTVEPEKEETQTEAQKIDHCDVTNVLEVVQEPTLDSGEGSLQSLEKEVLLSKTIPPAEIDADEPKQTEHLTEVTVEPEKEEPETESQEIDHCHVTDVLEVVQAATLDSGDKSVQSLPKEVPSSEVIPPPETITDEPKQTAEHLTEVPVEPEKEDLQTEAHKIDRSEAIKVLQVVQAVTLDSGEGSVPSLGKEVPSSEDILQAETITDEPKQTAEHLTEVTVEPEKEETQTEAQKIDHCDITNVLEVVQEPTLDSGEGGLQCLEKEVLLSKTIPPAEIDADEPKQTEHLTEVTVEPENKEPETESQEIDHCHVTDVLEVVQAATLDSGDKSVQSLEKEVPSSEVNPPAELDRGDPKEREEHLSHVTIQPRNEELQTEAPKMDYCDIIEELTVVQAVILDSEGGSVHSIEKDVLSEDITPAETMRDDPKEETVPLSEVNVEPGDASKTEHVQDSKELRAVQGTTLDSEAGSHQLLKKEVTSEDIPAVETVTDEPTKVAEVSIELEELPVEPHVMTPDINNIAPGTETNAEESKSAQMVEESSAQEKLILLKDVPEPASDNAIASVSEEIENKAVAQLDQGLDQETETILQDIQPEHTEGITEAAGELQTFTAVNFPSVNEEASSVQVLEKTVFPEESPVPCEDNAEVSEEPTHAVQVSAEEEKVGKLPSAEMKTVAAEHAVEMQVITFNLKEVSTEIPDVLIEKTSEIHEALIDKIASETEFKVTTESATVLVRDDVNETAKEGRVVVMMHTPSVEFEDNHRIQVQVVDVDMKSAESIVDTVVDVEAKHVMDVCHVTVNKVENLSATPEIEEDVSNEYSKVTVQQIIQHGENLPETIPDSVGVSLEQEVVKQPDAVTEVMIESELNQVEDQKVMKDSTGTFTEREDEEPTEISDNSATEHQMSEDHTETSDIPGDIFGYSLSSKEDSEVRVKTEDTTCPSAEVAMNKADEDTTEAQIQQTKQSQIVTPGDDGLVVPQHTGIISTIGNMEPPSSLSLELKLNIQFGQAKASAFPPPPTEKLEPATQTAVSKVGVQATEPLKTISAIQGVQSKIQTEQTEVTVQTTEITEPAAILDSTERAVITNQPVLLDIGTQVMEVKEPVEQIKSTERVTLDIHPVETIQPVRQAKRQVLVSQPAVCEACDQETRAEEPVKQTEEENDEDVWLDAEEDICTPEKTEEEEPLEPQTESQHEGKAELEHEFETAPNSKTEDEESQQEIHKTEGTCEIDSEGEDFAVAPEDMDTATASVTAVEWD